MVQSIEFEEVVSHIKHAAFPKFFPPSKCELTQIHIDFAQSHRVLGVLSTAVDAQADTPIAKVVHEARSRQVLWEQYFQEQTDRVVARLSKEGLQAHRLKGMVLCAQYPQRGWRAFHDADLWVDSKEVRKVHALLLSEGFAPLTTVSPLPSAPINRGDPISACEAGIDALNYQKNGYGLEIHTTILSPMLGTYEIHGMDPEDTFIHLLFHAVRHHFPHGLQHLVDLAIWCDRKNPRIDTVIERLQKSRLYDLAWPAWQLAHEQFDRVVPAPIPARRWASRLYTNRVREMFSVIPIYSKAFAGSPIPCLWMVDHGILRTLRAWIGTSATRQYREGVQRKNTTGNLSRLWQVGRRHKGPIMNWVKFFYRPKSMGIIA